MRLLHTSDWHVGKTIKGRSRIDEHRRVLDEITTIAREGAVDVIIVAGDLFESQAPPPDAEQVVYRALLGLAEIAPVVVVSGNHDNERRLTAVEPLLGLARITTRPLLERPEAGGVLAFETAEGEAVRVGLLPWVSQRGIVRAPELMGLDADDHAALFADRLMRVLDHLCAGFDGDAVNIIAGHAMVAGGALGGGERLAHTVFEYAISPTVFPASAHYVALGHLHRVQQLGGQPPVWYCGSPLQLDFGETEDEKCVLIAEATPTTPAVVERVPLQAGRRLRKVTGSLEQLRALAGATGDDYIRAVVREEARAGLSDEVREIFGDACVDVMIESQMDRTLGVDPRAHEGKPPGELFREYLSERKATDERVAALFDELLEEEHASASA